MKIKTLLFTLCMAGAMTANAATYYVSPEGTGTKDGSSSDNAFGVSEFTTQADANENGDIYYFAGGTYYISSTIVFKVGTGAYLYGNTEGDRTIFSGDANGDGIPNSGDSGRIIRFQANTADGNSSNAIIVKNIDFTCVFTNTTATSTSASTFTMGAFVVDNSGDVLVENCNFYNNKAGNSTTDCQGGPAAFLYRSTVKFLKCSFYDNETSARGGAVRFTSNDNAKGITIFDNCVFKNNICSGSMGGAIFGANFKSVTFNNCTAYGNSANSLGGFFFSNSFQSGTGNYARELNILNSTIANNNVTATNDAQITTRVSEHVNVVNSIIPSTDAVSAFAFTTASGFNSPDFQFVSGGYNLIGTMYNTPTDGILTWQDTDSHSDAMTYEAIFGENALNEDNVVIPAVYYAGATGEQVTAAVTDWTLPSGLDYTTDQLGNDRTGNVTPGAVAVSENEYVGYYLANSKTGDYGGAFEPNPSYRFQPSTENTYTLTVGSMLSTDKFYIIKTLNGKTVESYSSKDYTGWESGEENYAELEANQTDEMSLNGNYINVTFTLTLSDNAPYSIYYTFEGEMDSKDTFFISPGNDQTMQSGTVTDDSIDLAIAPGSDSGLVYIYVPESYKGNTIYYTITESDITPTESDESQNNDDDLSSGNNSEANDDNMIRVARKAGSESEIKEASITTEDSARYFTVSVNRGKQGTISIYDNPNGGTTLATFDYTVSSTAIPTGVLTLGEESENVPMYNIFGQKVDASYKGIVIKNGKKFILR